MHLNRGERRGRNDKSRFSAFSAVKIIFPILLIGWMCVSLGWADVAATHPAVGPREALKAFFEALTEGRPNDIAPLCVADDADSKSLMKDFVEMARSMTALRKQAAARFGPDQLDGLVGLMPADEDVDQMDEKTDGDSALIADKMGDPPVRMVLRDGTWKLDIADLRQGNRLSDDPHQFILGMTDAIQRTAADVEAGRLTSADAVRDALAAREMKVATAGGSASRPSSTP
jgi:hypothetical protein